MTEKNATLGNDQTIEKNELKKRLSAFLETDGNFEPGEKAEDYLGSLYHYIGDPDPEMRDDLVYPVFATLVSSDEYLSNEEVYDVLDKLLSEEFLQYQLGEVGTDGVFKRAFSALILVPIIERHLESPFLKDEQIRHIFEKCIHQFKGEADLRGFTEDKGWAHSNAHMADVFGQLLACEPLNKEFLPCILHGITYKVNQGLGVWTAEEDERLVTAIWRTFFTDSNMSKAWVETWSNEVVAAFETAKGMKRFYISMNGKNFFRSLYFRGLHHYPESDLLKVLMEVQSKLNRHLNY